MKEVNPVRYADYNDYLQLPDKKQELPGFDPEYHDIVDYILKITHRIWEEKGIGVIYDTYHNDVTMHCASTNLVGIKDVVANTLMTLHSFPDRRLIGEQVSWSKHDTNGFLSAHRVLSAATNLGEVWGRATGKKVNFRTVIDCAMDIYEKYVSKGKEASLKISMMISALWGILIYVITMLAFSGTSKSILAVIGSYISYISGPTSIILLVFFLLQFVALIMFAGVR